MIRRLTDVQTDLEVVRFRVRVTIMKGSSLPPTKGFRPRNPRPFFWLLLLLTLHLSTLLPDMARAQGDATLAPATGRVLVATRAQGDGYFARTVVLLLEFDRRGAIGLVLNHPSLFPARALLDSLAGSPQGEQRAWRGGPVSRERIFVLARRTQPPAQAVAVQPGLWAATRGEAVALAVDEDWDEYHWRVFFGYAGWGAGQLEGEIARGDWQVRDAAAATLLETAPDRLWQLFDGTTSGRWAGWPARRALALPTVAGVNG